MRMNWFVDLSGEENLNMTVEDDEFCDLPDVILVDELNEKFDQAVCFGLF